MFIAGGELRIDGVIWRIAAHPSAPQSPWSRLGGTSVVHRLEGPSGPRALKVFEPAWREGDHEARARQLETMRDLDGLRAAERRVVTAFQTDGPPVAAGALWMPWIEGYTWSDVVRVRTALTPEQSLHVARALAAVLARLEARGVAHCNLSGESVMITTEAVPTVQLIDLEHVFAPAMPSSHPPSKGAPALVRAGTPPWEARADRFSGAIVLAEMLGWCDGAVRAAAASTRYFESEELLPGPRSARARLLSERLAAIWGASVAALFEQAFGASAPVDAPPLSAWASTLATAKPSPAPPAGGLSPPAAPPASSARRVAPPFAAPNVVDAGASPTALRMGGAAPSSGPSAAPWITALALLVLVGAGGFFLMRWRPSTSSPSSVAGTPAPSSAASAAPAAASPSSPAPPMLVASPSARPTSAPSPSPSATEAPTSAPSAVPDPVPEMVGALREVVMCRRVDAKGAPVEPVRAYDPFSPFCCAFRVTAGHRGAEIKATWRDPQGFSRTTTATVGAEEESYVNVTLQSASGAWIMGSYSLVLQMAGTPDKEVRFDVSATGR